ncbi:hypothetical protein DSB67_06745 [Vibrio campbellii]|nr:hypothetical protein DSB67_06745 [Vibrio campbellii]
MIREWIAGVGVFVLACLSSWGDDFDWQTCFLALVVRDELVEASDMPTLSKGAHYSDLFIS